MTTRYPISGIYEICIGVETDDELQAVQSYFKQFGYGPATQSTTTLSSAQAAEQYGHAASLSSVRLAHTDSDHGLLRIWKWASLKNTGVPIGPLRARGRRWGTTLTEDIFNIANHARIAQSMDEDVRTLEFNPETGTKKVLSRNMYTVEPISFPFFDTDTSTAEPFVDKLPTEHEMVLVREFSTQVLYERHDIVLKNYGKINTEARFPSSQFNHCALVITGNGDELKFYEDVLGLSLSRETESSYDESTYGILDTRKGGKDRVFLKTFDDPRSGKTWAEARSGRLYCLRWDPGLEIPDVTDLCNPGCKGMTGYTYRVRGIDEFRRKVVDGGGEKVSNVLENEFGERSFSFFAPDGYWWQLIEWED